MRWTLLRRALPCAAPLLFAACTDTSNPTGTPTESPAPAAAPLVRPVTCVARVDTKAVTCDGAPQGGRGDLVMGGQNTFVKLTSSNVRVFADTFAFDVVVKNLGAQPIGTRDWSSLTADPAGIRVFFASPPTISRGTITVANPDGLGTFTGTNQPYFQYDQVLPQNATSGAKTWKLQFSDSNATFTFTLFVSTPVPYETGYIDGLPRLLMLEPGETFTMPGTVRNALGVPTADQGFTMAGGDFTIATTAGRDVTGRSQGATTLFPYAGSKVGVASPPVAVCPALLVAASHDYVRGSLSTSDCWAAMDVDENFLPARRHYGDLYRIWLTEGQRIQIKMEVDGWDPSPVDRPELPFSSLVVLSDRLGRVVAVGEDAVEAGWISFIEFTVPTSGLYIIEATTSSFQATGNYILETFTPG